MKKSIVAKKKLKAITLLVLKTSFKSPGGGLEPYMYDEVVEKN